MNWFDFLLLSGALLGSYISYHQGILMELNYIVSIALGFLFSLLLYPMVRPFLRAISGFEYWGAMGAFLLVFLFVGGVITLVGLFLQRYWKSIRWRGLDNKGGAVLGFFKTVFLLALFLVLFAGLFHENQPDFLEESLLSRPLIRITTDPMRTSDGLFKPFMKDFGSRARALLRESDDRY